MLKPISLAAALTAALACSAHAQGAIKVGVVTPLSGSYAPIGKQVRWGAELAVKEINAAGGGKGPPVEILFEDGKTQPPVPGRKAEKLPPQGKGAFLTRTPNTGSPPAVGPPAGTKKP